MSGRLDEEAVEFRHDVDFTDAGRFRSIAGVGPAYEVLSANAKTVRIRMIDADEEYDYPRADAELDPRA